MKKDNIINIVKIVILILLGIIVSFEVTKFLLSGDISKLMGSVNTNNLVIKKNKYVRFELKNTQSTVKQRVGSDIKIKRNNSYQSDYQRLATGDILELPSKDYTIYVLADLNSDGMITKTDVSQAYNYIKGKKNLTELEYLSADYTEDDKVNIHDVSKIYNTFMTTDDTHKVYIQFDMNGGFISSKSTNKSYSSQGNLVTYNNSTILHTIPYGEQLSDAGLLNWNNTKNMYVEKTGYLPKTNAEYINPQNNKTYDMSTPYKASDFCDASNGDCVVTLKINWQNKIKVTFDANGGSVTTTSKDVYVNSTYGTLPTPTRSGYKFMGWFDDSKSKNDSKVYYKNQPLYYYADINSDVYNVYKYNINKLYSHYIEYGIKEGRRTSQYLKSDKVTATKNITLHAGWMPISMVATFDANGGTVTALNNTFTYSGKVSGDGWPRIKYENNSSYGQMPSVTRSGYTFMGWYECDKTASKATNIKYKDNPLYYYADIYSDLYKTFGYNEQKLVNHLQNYGKAEGRRTSQIISTDKVKVSDLKTVSYCAGWIKTPVKNRNSVCGVSSTQTSCIKYKTCQNAVCGKENKTSTTSNTTYANNISTQECNARHGEAIKSWTEGGNKVLDRIDTVVKSLRTSANNAPINCQNNAPSGYSYVRAVKNTQLSTGGDTIYDCYYEKAIYKTTPVVYKCNCKITTSKNVTTTVNKTCATSACGCAQTGTTTTYNECWHW